MLKTLDVTSSAEWHSWLEENHLREQGVWLVFHKKGAPTISYSDALDEALAFGWIDSVIKRVDDEKYVRKFSPRHPGSIWSTININRVSKLKRQGRMTKWGLAAFSKRTGELSMMEKVTQEGVVVPKDLEDALRKNDLAWRNFQGFTDGYRKKYLIWIKSAKRPETRKKRIDEAVELIARNVKNLLK